MAIPTTRPEPATPPYNYNTVSVLIRPAASSLVVAANAQAPTTPTGLLPGTIIDIAYRGRLMTTSLTAATQR